MKTSQIWGRKWTSKFKKLNELQLGRTQKAHLRTKQNLKTSKRKVTHHVQGMGMIISRFLSRNVIGQKGVKGYIQSAERKICQPRILYQAKVSFKSEEVKIFLDKQKLREFITCFARTVKESPSSWNKRTLSNNTKADDDPKLLGKGKHIDKHRILQYCHGGGINHFQFRYRISTINQNNYKTMLMNTKYKKM